MPWEAANFNRIPEIVGKTFDNQEITLDGTAYTTCTFNKCKLIYHGGPTRLSSCSISPGCGFEFQDSAAFLLQMLAELGWKLVPPALMGPSQTHSQ